MQHLAIGDTIALFTLQEIKQLGEYQAVGYRFVHASGMEVCFVENEDSEQFFSFVFRTIPEDSSGVAHILEHSTLSGSARYPVHDPFMMLEKASVNTYMNAMTYPDKTLYLAASPLSKDFDNLFDVYSDAVFAPLLRKEAFQQEGVRLVDDAKGGHWEGVVFSEMQGAASNHDSIVFRAVIRSLFPDTCYAYESGGDPASIVDLSWEKYKAFYHSHYHSGNCKLFLYGKNDITSILTLLDERYLHGRSYRKPVPPSPSSKAWRSDYRIRLSSPKEAGGKKRDCSIVMGWACSKSDDSLEIQTLNTIVDLLLDDPTCPLYKALLESALAEDISPECGMTADFPQMTFIAGFKGIEAGREEEVEKVVLASLRKICKEGIGRDAIEGSLKRARFKQQEISGSIPQGIKLLGRSLHGWMAEKGPFATIEAASALDRLEMALKEDPLYLEHWIERNILENHHRVTVSVVPDEGYLPRQKEILDKKAKEAMLASTKEENARFHLYEETPEEGEVLAKVPHLLLADLPLSIKPDTYTQKRLGSTPLWWKRQFTCGIEYVMMAIDVSDFREEEYLALPLYSRMMSMSGLGDMDGRMVSLALKRLCGSFGVATDNARLLHGHKSRSWLYVQMGFLRQDRKEALDLVFRLLREAKVDDPKRIKVAIGDLKGDYAESVTYAATFFATQYAQSLFSESAQDAEKLGGITQWKWLDQIGENEYGPMGKRLLSVQKHLSQRGRITLGATSEDESLLGDLEAMLEKFPEGRTREEGRSYHLLEKGEHQMKAFTLPNDVAYVCQVSRTADAESQMQVAETLLGQMMATGDLWKLVRMRGGAYGVDARTDLLERLFIFSTYRDPRIQGSFNDFRETLEKKATQESDPKELEQAKISTIGTELKPRGPEQELTLSFRRRLYEYDDTLRSKRREFLLSLSPKEIRDAAKLLQQAISDCDVKVVFSSSKRIKEELGDVQGERLPL